MSSTIKNHLSTYEMCDDELQFNSKEELQQHNLQEHAGETG
jgi:hypothetical protein